MKIEFQDDNVRVSAAKSDADLLTSIYKEKYIQFRHFDNLRWKLPGLVATGGAALLAAGGPSNFEGFGEALCLYGVFSCLFARTVQRIRSHATKNVKVLRAVAEKLGDLTISEPIPKSVSATHWIAVSLYGVGGAAICGGLVEWTGFRIACHFQ